MLTYAEELFQEGEIKEENRKARSEADRNDRRSIECGRGLVHHHLGHRDRSDPV